MAPTPAPPAPPARARHGAHRGGGGLAAALVPSLLAVAAVAALITALAVWQAEEPSRPGRVAAATQHALRDARSGAAASPTPSSAVATTAPPAGSATASPTQGPAESSAESPREPSAAADPVNRSSIEVVVLNQTSRTGLAGSVAERLRGVGWTVPAVGNFTGIVPATTVYYPPGAQQAALAVARDLPTEPRTRPRFGNLSTTRLTVVVTDSYPG